MASLLSSRLGFSIIWTIRAPSHTRTLAVSLTTTERASHRRRASSHSLPTRCFSTQPQRSQEPPSTTNYYRRNTNNFTPNRSSTTRSPQPSASPANAEPSTTSSSSPASSTTNTPISKARAPPPPITERNVAANPPQEPIVEISSAGLSDLPQPAKIPADANPEQVDWASSFHGLSSQPFSAEAQEILLAPINVDDIEIKPDGILYLPEIKYRRILNRAFGPGGWGLAPRGETIVTAKCVTREYALLASGRLVSIARGEQDYFDPEGIPTATEGCKSNALMRCCKDLGVASELWDPRYIRRYMAENAKEVWVEHAVTKKRKKLTMRKDDEVRYPHREVKAGDGGARGP